MQFGLRRRNLCGNRHYEQHVFVPLSSIGEGDSFMAAERCPPGMTAYSISFFDSLALGDLEKGSRFRSLDRFEAAGGQPAGRAQQLPRCKHE